MKQAIYIIAIVIGAWFGLLFTRIIVARLLFALSDWCKKKHYESLTSEERVVYKCREISERLKK